MRKKYLSISEFGKICNVNRKTLIYYHNAGVFSPEKIGKNGYRYYNINQYETFNILKAFRELGVSIDEIKEYLRDRNPKEYLNILDKEKQCCNSLAHTFKHFNFRKVIILFFSFFKIN